MVRTATLLAVASTAAIAQAFVPAPAVLTQSAVSAVPTLSLRTSTWDMSPVARSRCVMMSSVDADALTRKMQVTGTNVEVTPAMREYVQKKLGKVLSKPRIVSDNINRVEVHLSVIYFPKAKHSHTCEATVYMKGGQVLRSSEETDFMYASIDLVSHRLARLLRKYKERRVTSRKGASFEEEAGVEADDADASFDESYDNFEDPANAVDLSLVKKKSFDMPPMSVADAIVALEFLSHPFYVFQNEETKAINVVYKRNKGGFGLIEPEAK